MPTGTAMIEERRKPDRMTKDEAPMWPHSSPSSISLTAVTATSWGAGRKTSRTSPP